MLPSYVQQAGDEPQGLAHHCFLQLVMLYGVYLVMAQ
ncbi:Uncharacterised protein [Vibrio cholerae]|nr:Uncharacterised protein [Vibrio cholerae]